MLLDNIDNSQLSTLILENIMANMPGHVYWKDINGVYLGCNDKQAQTLGLQFGNEVVGKTDFDLPWPTHSAQQFHDNDQRIMFSGIAEAVEEIISEQNDIVFSIKAPIKNEQGTIYGILGISIDITEKKRLERLEKEREIAQKNSELMNILSSSVAHEIRTPLSIIKINADLISISDIADHLPKCPERTKFLNRIDNIHQAIKECTQVMDMLLVKLKKIATNDSEQKDLDTCSITETIQTALSEYPFRDNEKKWVHYLDNSEDFSYLGHTRLTKHILFNLIKNALHVIQEAQKGEVFIESRTGEQFNQLIFRDTALGIDPSYISKIFNKFETTDDTHSGTGLGLAFCRLVMESYGGQITCQSELRQFTEFTLSFPVI